MARGRGRGRGGSKAGNVKRRFGGREPHLLHRLQQKTSATQGTSSSSSTSHHRPRRGPPAIFVTCEAGREHKCKREAMELMHHYYYASRDSNDDVVGKVTNPSKLADTTITTNRSTTTVCSPLNLEEELAMLRKGAVAEEVLSYQPNSKRPRLEGGGDGGGASMKSPFAIYDTGMRGMICILCTLPHCEYVPYDEILMQLRSVKVNDKEKDNHSDDNDGDRQTSTTSAEKKVEKEPAPSTLQSCAKGIRDEAKESENTNVSSPIPWDPVQTVKCILSDAKKKRKSDEDEEGRNSTKVADIESTATSNNSITASPPGSRFISRILPMQATVSFLCIFLSHTHARTQRNHSLLDTMLLYSSAMHPIKCYASIEEIKAVSLSLLSRCLPNIFQSKNPTHAAADENKDVNLEGGIKYDTTNITFKLEIKMRLCTHLTRIGVIEAVTPLILGGGGRLGLLPGCTFSVNLTDPDFSLR